MARTNSKRLKIDAQIFEAEITDRLSRNGSLANLLRLEKERRAIPEDRLQFVGVRNLARYWWCAQQAVLVSRIRESSFFGSYIYDRIWYSYLLGTIDDLPKSEEDLLLIGEDISREDIESILESRSSSSARSRRRQSTSGSPIETPTQRGISDEKEFAEKYPTIRWNYSLGQYVVVGVPDGISDQFTYEFKSIRNLYISRFTKPVATTQADIYGVLLQRPNKRVQLRLIEDNETLTIEELVDLKRVEQTVERFTNVDSGQLATPPSVLWKCKPSVCEVRDRCDIKLV